MKKRIIEARQIVSGLHFTALKYDSVFRSLKLVIYFYWVLVESLHYYNIKRNYFKVCINVHINVYKGVNLNVSF